MVASTPGRSNKPIILPPDIQPSWLTVIRRLKGIANRAGQPVMVDMTIFIDEYGCPRLWTEPQCYKLEPGTRASDRLDEMQSDFLYLADEDGKKDP